MKQESQSEQDIPIHPNQILQRRLQKVLDHLRQNVGVATQVKSKSEGGQLPTPNFAYDFNYGQIMAYMYAIELIESHLALFIERNDRTVLYTTKTDGDNPS